VVLISSANEGVYRPLTHHEIEATDQGRRLNEISELRSQVDDAIVLQCPFGLSARRSEVFDAASTLSCHDKAPASFPELRESSRSGCSLVPLPLGARERE